MNTAFSWRPRLKKLADYCVIGVALALPWSTSAVSILAGIWAVLAVLTVDFSALRMEIRAARSAFPVLFFVLGVVGMAWSIGPFGDRLHSAIPYLRLLAIPLLILQFRRSDFGNHVIYAFLASCIVLVAASYLSVLAPNLLPVKQIGVPVKSYIPQSAEFTVCAFGLLYIAGDAWKAHNVPRALLSAFLAALFVVDIVYVASSRTTLVILPLLFLLWATVQFGKRAVILLLAIGIVASGLLWASSSYLRDRIDSIFTEFHRYENQRAVTSVGERLEFWKKSLRFVADAPIMGHGVGSTKTLFAQAVSSADTAQPTTNPHNQTLAVAIQLGAVGVVVLWLMWMSHAFMFRGEGAYAWFGLLVVAQHVAGGIFNTYLFDFTEGWLYVFGVGVLGGITIAMRDAAATGPAVDRSARR